MDSISCLSERDRQIAESLRQEGVFKEVQEGLLCLKKGGIVFACGDGDRLLDQIDFLSRLVSRHCSSRRLHGLLDHGGALLFSPRFQEECLGYSNGVIHAGEFAEKILFAVVQKEIRQIFASVHAPCLVASGFSLNLARTVEYGLDAKAFLEDFAAEYGQQALILPLVHIDWGVIDGSIARKMRTYSVDRAKWSGWAADNAPYLKT